MYVACRASCKLCIWIAKTRHLCHFLLWLQNQRRMKRASSIQTSSGRTRSNPIGKLPVQKIRFPVPEFPEVKVIRCNKYV